MNTIILELSSLIFYVNHKQKVFHENITIAMLEYFYLEKKKLVIFIKNIYKTKNVLEISS